MKDKVSEAARDFVMGDLVTKADLTEVLERHTLALTVRLGTIVGAMIGVAVAIVSAVVKLT